MARKVSNKELQDFVEGRLSQKDLSRDQAFLRKNPEIENKLEALRKQAEMTRNLGKMLLDEPVPPT
jgi:anti-sigma factor RsiW